MSPRRFWGSTSATCARRWPQITRPGVGGGGAGDLLKLRMARLAWANWSCGSKRCSSRCLPAAPLLRWRLRFTHIFRPGRANPKGIVSPSPGLRAASYPGKRCPGEANPNGVATTAFRPRPQPRWGNGAYIVPKTLRERHLRRFRCGALWKMMLRERFSICLSSWRNLR